MALENVSKFEERINEDEALRARLKELAEAFDGDREDPRAIFEAVITPLATEVGLPYTYDEALEYVTQKADDEDISADEVRAAAGGINDFCLLVGFGDVAANLCADITAYGANACAGVGVGGLVS